MALEDTSIFRAKGENPFLATSPTVGQVLLESKQQLEPQVLHGGGIRLGRCARQDVQEGRVDKRVLAMLEYLSVSGLRPTVSGLPCAARDAGGARRQRARGRQQPRPLRSPPSTACAIAGHQGAGSIADTTVRKLLMLQGLSRPQQIVSLMSYPGAAAALDEPERRDAIRVELRRARRGRRARGRAVGVGAHARASGSS